MAPRVVDLLVIGFGSIGARHARLASILGHRVSVVSRRADIDWPSKFGSVRDALQAKSFEHAIVANETSRHRAEIDQLVRCGFQGKVLVEKPIGVTTNEVADLPRMVRERTFVGYNLRFHPAIRRLKEALKGKEVINAIFYAGQDLRSWRPGREVSSCYSASSSAGGGVLRDLSHELDLFTWLLGDWNRLCALGGRIGPLHLQADDCWGVLVSSDNCAIASVQVDYYAKPAARKIFINTAEEAFSVDLIRSSYSDQEGKLAWNVDRDSTYISQLDELINGPKSEPTICTFEQGLRTVKMIEAIESSALQMKWESA